MKLERQNPKGGARRGETTLTDMSFFAARGPPRVERAQAPAVTLGKKHVQRPRVASTEQPAD